MVLVPCTALQQMQQAPPPSSYPIVPGFPIVNDMAVHREHSRLSQTERHVQSQLQYMMVPVPIPSSQQAFQQQFASFGGPYGFPYGMTSPTDYENRGLQSTEDLKAESPESPFRDYTAFGPRGRRRVGRSWQDLDREPEEGRDSANPNHTGTSKIHGQPHQNDNGRRPVLPVDGHDGDLKARNDYIPKIETRDIFESNLPEAMEEGEVETFWSRGNNVPPPERQAPSRPPTEVPGLPPPPPRQPPFTRWSVSSFGGNVPKGKRMSKRGHNRTPIQTLASALNSAAPTGFWAHSNSIYPLVTDHETHVERLEAFAAQRGLSLRFEISDSQQVSLGFRARPILADTALSWSKYFSDKEQAKEEAAKDGLAKVVTAELKMQQVLITINKKIQAGDITRHWHMLASGISTTSVQVSDITKLLKDLRAQVLDKMQADDRRVKIIETVESGSYSRGTSIHSESLELIVFMEPPPDRTPETLRPRAGLAKILKGSLERWAHSVTSTVNLTNIAALPGVVPFMVDGQTISMVLCAKVSKDQLVDFLNEGYRVLQPFPNDAGSVAIPPDGAQRALEWKPFFAPEEVQFWSEGSLWPDECRDLVRLVKLWGSLVILPKGKSVIGWDLVLECLAFWVWEDVTFHSGPRTLPVLFHQVISLLGTATNLHLIFKSATYDEDFDVPDILRRVRPLILNPVNPFDNVMGYSDQSVWEAVEKAAKLSEEIIEKFMKETEMTLADLCTIFTPICDEKAPFRVKYKAFLLKNESRPPNPHIYVPDDCPNNYAFEQIHRRGIPASLLSRVRVVTITKAPSVVGEVDRSAVEHKLKVFFESDLRPHITNLFTDGLRVDGAYVPGGPYTFAIRAPVTEEWSVAVRCWVEDLVALGGSLE
ncbi:hypothetical protein HDU93_003316 [Gonapodya sp. JEL0774]|nr:hypothetical protein HDU93_003316 [Gonapodya sp. JEL0774]